LPEVLPAAGGDMADDGWMAVMGMVPVVGRLAMDAEPAGDEAAVAGVPLDRLGLARAQRVFCGGGAAL
jgi:hypothetical protein